MTPNDWWWHTKYGMLAIPMSALKRYKWVITAIAVTTFLIGSMWHVQEAFRHIFSIDIIESEIMKGDAWSLYLGRYWKAKTFVYFLGAFLAIPFIWNGEMVVDKIGHSNIFILAFVSYALRFAGLYFNNDFGGSWVSFFEILEPISFYLPWLAVLLYVRHLVPKRFLAISQAIFVILFFALGRAVGFFYGTSIAHDDLRNFKTSEKYSDLVDHVRWNEIVDLKNIHTNTAAAACIAALLYFVIYHLILLPKYLVPINRLQSNNDPNMSPQQRVFHDKISRKGYFRY